MPRRAPQLRSTLTTITVLICAFAVLASTALIALSTALHATILQLGEASESIHLAEQAQLELLVHSRTSDRFARQETEHRVRRALVSAERLISSRHEASALREARAEFEAYAAAARAGAVTDQLEPMVARTYDAFERLVNVNIVLARDGQERAARWDRMANLFGLSTTVLLLALTIWLVVWLRTRAFQPLFDLADAIRRFTEGDRDALIPEGGPQELRAITRRFNELAAALASQRKAQMAFLGGVAHDLRSPLSAMSVSVAAFSPDRPLPPEPRVRRAFELIGRQLTRVERMLGDLLDMAKIEAGQLELDVKLHDARTLVEATVRMFEEASPLHRIEVELPHEEIPLRCDALRVEQVLGNLVSNAIKYSPAGGAVRVGVRREGERAVFEVADSGIGIAKEAMPALFEPFRRGEHGREGIPGAGLGLSVVRRIVGAHGGTIDVSSAPGKGSTFRVALPAAMVAVAVERAVPWDRDLHAS